MIRSFALALASALSCIMLLLWLSDGVGWARGYAYSGDELQTLVMSKALLENGDPQFADRLNAPMGGDWRAFPLITPVEFGFIWLFGQLGADCFQATGGTFLLIVATTAVVALAAFRELEFAPPVCFVLACAYTLQPFLWEHNLTHPHLLFPWTAGMAVGLLRVAQGGWGGRLPRWLLIMALLQGFSSLYLAYFAILLWLPATLSGWCHRGRKAVVQALILLLPLLVGVAIHLFLAQAAHAQRPVPEGLRGQGLDQPSRRSTDRRASESELYGLKLRILLSPRPAHPLPPLAELAHKLHDPFPDDQPEAVMARLGSLASLGLLLALIGLLFPRFRRGQAPWSRMAISLILFLLLLACVGGVSAMINSTLLNKFRCYNRTLVFLSFYALALIGLWLPKRWWLVLIVPLLAVDQFIPRPRHFPTLPQPFENDRTCVQQVEAYLPSGSSVYQFPHRNALAPPALHNLRSNEPAIGFLHGKSLRWSWGALPNIQSRWHLDLAQLPWDQRLARLRELGFAALWLDRHGLGPEAHLVERELMALLGPVGLASPDARYWIFRLKPSGKWAKQARMNPVETTPLTEEESLKVQLSLTSPPTLLRVLPKSTIEVTLKLENGSRQWLWGQGEHPVNVSYHWLDDKGRMVEYDGHRHHCVPLWPGGQRCVVLQVKTPVKRGDYRLQVRLVQEGVRWFESENHRVPADLPVKCGWR